MLNGIGAIYGGQSLIRYPDGSDLQIPLSYLEHSPFTDFLIPGIILFTANGLFSFFVAAAILLKYKKHALLVLLQGLILMGWIIIQMIMIREINSLHIVMGSTGLLLVVLGWFLHLRRA